jgi:hypothetical protein
MSFTEHMEHAAHSGHGHGDGHKDDGSAKVSKRIGITMAMLGVLLALCSAMLGGARSAMISTMVEQATVAGKAQAVSTKHRTLMAQLQQLHALMPTDEATEVAAERTIAQIQAANQTATNAPIITVTRLEAARILNTVTPSSKDVMTFVSRVRDYDKERTLADAWYQSFGGAIHAHDHAAHHFEWALLCSEFGIVLCSIALLLSSRKLWYGAIALGSLGVTIAAVSVASYHSELTNAEATIVGAKTAFGALGGHEARKVEDERLLVEIEEIEKRKADRAKKAP